MRLPSLHNDTALQPHELCASSQQALQELLREGESVNTRASYRSALRYFAGWFHLRYGQPITLPLPASGVLQFIVDHAQRSTPKGLVHQLPPAIDQALVAARIKGQIG